MGILRVRIEDQLNSLRVMTASDFCALAWIDTCEQHIYWKYAAGNLNERYKQMKGRAGRGLAGTVVRFGRPLVVDETLPYVSNQRLEYPIMLAEGLQAAAAVPVTAMGETCGVLLIGHRTARSYTSDEIKLITDGAERIGLLNHTPHYNVHEA